MPITCDQEHPWYVGEMDRDGANTVLKNYPIGIKFSRKNYEGSFQEKGTLFRKFKIQVDDIILPWVADGVPMNWWVTIS